ncbi:armadillo-type protein [Sporodiniella umbellata]|nr:armadillo-type protein [Sporodiniella umbellata]
MIAEFTAAIVSKCCDTPEEQIRLKNAGVVQPLVDILHSKCLKAQETSLEALAGLCHENRDSHLGPIASYHGLSTLNTVLDFTKGKCSTMRLIACTCLTNLYRTGVFPELSNDIVIIVLPALVKLLEEKEGNIQERAPLILADLIKDSPEMQNAAYEADAISRLAELLASVSTPEKEDRPNLGIPGTGSLARRREKTKENSLIALAAATLLNDECRKQALKANILPHVINGVHSPKPNVRLAACQCAKSLSRGVNHLRTSFVDSNIAPPLRKLLNDESITVQAAACGVLCNLALEFSPVKTFLIESGALSKFVGYSKSEDINLRINGVWAITSILYKASLNEKKSVMEILTFDALLELLHDSDQTVQEKALTIVRNLVYGPQEDTDWVYRNIGKDDLLDVIESKLQGMDTDEEESTFVPSVTRFTQTANFTHSRL